MELRTENLAEKLAAMAHKVKQAAILDADERIYRVIAEKLKKV